MDDKQLLREYVENKSQRAFAALTERHLRLVYGACLRELQDPSLAEDATQIVFIILADKAHSLRSAGALASWLFTTARYTASNLRTQETRRRRREEQSLEQSMANEQADKQWEEVSGEIDNAVAALKGADQQIVLLRYFDDLSFKEAAEALGIAENTARMRSSRAVEKLRRHLVKAGVAITSAGLATLLASETARAAPAASAASIAAGAFEGHLQTASSSIVSSSLQTISQGVAQQMVLSKLKIVSLLACVVVVGVVGTYVARTHAAIRSGGQAGTVAPAPAGAQDLTITMHDMTTTSMPQMKNMPPQAKAVMNQNTTVYRSGDKHRVDTPTMSIIDTMVNGRLNMIYLNNLKKTYYLAETNPAKLSSIMKFNTYKVVDTGKTTTLLGHVVRHYTEDLSMTLLLPKIKGMPTGAVTTTHIDILAAQDLPGWKAYSADTTSPLMPAGMPPTTQIKGIPLAITLTTTGLLGTRSTSTSVATSISTKPLPASLFEVPSDYKEVPAPGAQFLKH